MGIEQWDCSNVICIMCLISVYLVDTYLPILPTQPCYILYKSEVRLFLLGWLGNSVTLSDKTSYTVYNQKYLIIFTKKNISSILCCCMFILYSKITW